MLVAVVAELLSKEFIEFKQNRYVIQAVGDSASAAVAHTENAVPHVGTAEDGSLEHLVIRVSNIPHGLSEHVVQMILENKRYGGGTVRRMEFSELERCAIVEYEDRAGKSLHYSLVSWTVFLLNAASDTYDVC